MSGKSCWVFENIFLASCGCLMIKKGKVDKDSLTNKVLKCTAVFDQALLGVCEQFFLETQRINFTA